MSVILLPAASPVLLDQITDAINTRGWCFVANALPLDHCNHLLQLAMRRREKFTPAAVGRKQARQVLTKQRTDRIQWINGETRTEQQWLAWMDKLRLHLNQQLYLGLYNFESHFAHYPVNAFYRRHVDAFRGDANRKLSAVLYLNENWTADEGGALVLYPAYSQPQSGEEIGRFLPVAGSLILFMSEEFPHEVLPANRDRYSIAGWFHVSSSGSKSLIGLRS